MAESYVLAVPRESPYIRTTRPTKLFTGESSCEFAAWFKAHHPGRAKQRSDFNLTWLQIEHAALLADTKSSFEGSGYDVFIERPNASRFQGRSAVLAGQPDVIVVCRAHTLIVKVKTGAERPYHVARVMIYRCVLPRSLGQYHDARISGEIYYPNGIQRDELAKGVVDSRLPMTSIANRQQQLNRSQGGMCICYRSGIGLGGLDECLSP